MLNVAGRKLPPAIKPFLKRTLYRWIPLRWRMGRSYWQLRSFLAEAQWWEREQIEAWQLEKMRATVDYAYNHVPGYHQLYREAGYHPGDLRTLADVQSLPFVTRTLMQENNEAFISDAIPAWQRFRETTGGSSGTPLGFYKTKTSLIAENAFVHSHWGWVDWRFGSRAVILRGPLLNSDSRLWDADPADRSLFLSTFHLTPSNYPQYQEKIKQYKAPNLQAYPSTAVLLANQVLEAGQVGELSFDYILLGSEVIQPWQIARLKKAFPNARITAHYGMTEQVTIGAWCKENKDYHISPFYGLTEYVSPKDSIERKVDLAEIVGTSFWNQATPFIRYRTGDLAKRTGTRCTACGRQFDLISKIEGRTGQYVRGANGNLFSLTSLIFAQHFEAFSAIKNFQLVQEKPGEVLIRVEPTAGFNDQHRQEIISRMEKAAGGQLTVSLETVDAITRTLRGKNLFLIQKLGVLKKTYQNNQRESQ